MVKVVPLQRFVVSLWPDRRCSCSIVYGIALEVSLSVPQKHGQQRGADCGRSRAPGPGTEC